MKRDEGSIYKTPDGKRWYARLRYTDADGQGREKKRTCPSHALAKAEISKMRFEIDREQSGRKTYREADAYYRERYVHDAVIVDGQVLSGFRQSLDTVNRYLDRALEYFKDAYLNEITHFAVEQYARTIRRLPVRENEQRSVSDINHHLKRLRRIFKIAIQKGWLVADPFTLGDPLIKESSEPQRTRTLSVEEESRLLDACDRWRQHLQPLIIFAVETAMRRGEIQRLKWSHVDLSRRVIRVEGTTTKTLKPRLVPISSRLRDVLSQLRQNTLRPHSPVFGTADFKRAFNKACEIAEMPDVHFHDLRHTGTTRMIERGLPIAVVMAITGHTQMKTFLRYVNQSESSMYEIALKLDTAAAPSFAPSVHLTSQKNT